MVSTLAIAWMIFAHPCPETSAGRPTSPPTQPQLRSGVISNRDYPASAIAARAEGMTRTRLDINADGRVTGCTVIRSSGNSALDSTTCSLAQRRYRFQPATSDGQPVPGTYSMSIRWSLPVAAPAESTPLAT